MPYHHHHHHHQELLDRVGHFQVPYLEDANEGVYLFESAAIVQYLRAPRHQHEAGVLAWVGSLPAPCTC
jgi:glutathione S-transferase